VKVNIWRASSEKVLQRAVAEARANRNTVDIVETNGPEMESLHREKGPAADQVADHADLIAPAMRPHGEWVGNAPERVRAGLQHQGRQRRKIFPSAGRISSTPSGREAGIEAEDSTGSRPAGRHRRSQGNEALQGNRGEKRGYRCAKGTRCFAQLVVSGEVAARADRIQLQGRTVQGQGRADRLVFHSARRSRGRTGWGVARRAPHPHAAVLFYDFEISGGRPEDPRAARLRADHRKIDTPLNKLPLKFVDARVTLDEYDKW